MSWLPTDLRAPSWAAKPARLLGFVLLVALVLAFNVPLIWMVFTALKDETEIYKYPPTFFSSHLTFQTVLAAWRTAPWPRYLANTLFVASATALLQVALASFAGYALTLKFKGSKLIFLAMLGTMMIPEETTLVAKYLVVSKLGWANTYWALVVPGMASAFAVFMFRQFFLAVPKDFFEAAQVDGCGYFHYMRAVGLPLAKSVALTVGLLSFIDHWNSTLWPLVVINNDKLRLVQIALIAAFADARGMPWGQMMAACTFVTLPIVILFMFIQKQFIDGVAASGIKG